MSKELDDSYQRLLDGNKLFVERQLASDPQFFEKLASTQAPQYLWIGCSDSRVPASQITNTQPGSVFVHRNIANVVVHTDMNVLSVLEYAVTVLKVQHVIVCGHYGCGGIKAAMSGHQYGVIDNWLCNIKDVYRMHEDALNVFRDPRVRERRLTELNVIEQVLNVCKTSTIQRAWQERDQPEVHGWVYDVSNGVINDLGVTVGDPSELDRIYHFSQEPHADRP